MSALSQPFPARQASTSSARIGTLLELARRHLGVDLAFLGEFIDGQEIYRTVAGDGHSFGLVQGGSLPLADTYCQAMIEGRIERVVPDSAAAPAVADLAVTTAGRIGRYIGVPVHLPDGHLYGALCGLGHMADPTLGPRDARLLEFLAELVSEELAREVETSQHQRHLVATVAPLLDGSGITMVFQPIVNLSTGTTVAFEALARFDAEPVRGPDAWFADAAEAGLGIQLELAALIVALRALDQLPSDTYLSINASAENACSPQFAALLAPKDLRRVMLEITEHAAVANYIALNDALRPLRSAGMRLAVDDAGAGVASLHHVLELNPDLIKLDISLISGIDTNPVQAALATAMVSFGAATGAFILAEGIETTAELDTLYRLGVGYGQGYLLGRPTALPTPAVNPRPAQRRQTQIKVSTR